MNWLHKPQVWLRCQTEDCEAIHRFAKAESVTPSKLERQKEESMLPQPRGQSLGEAGTTVCLTSYS